MISIDLRLFTGQHLNLNLNFDSRVFPCCKFVNKKFLIDMKKIDYC